MGSKRIYHLCRQSDWLLAASKGVYEGSEQDRADGFLHFSTASEIEDSAARHRAGEPDLLLLVADPSMLGDKLRWEPASSGTLFPHLYAPLPLAAILEVVPLPLGPEGAHVFPLLIDE